MNLRLTSVLLTVGTLGLMLFAGCKKNAADASTAAPVAVKEWTFDAARDTGGFRVADGEFWQYTGAPVLSFDDTSFGSGMLKFDLDFSLAENQTSWSEVKLKTDLPEAINLDGVSRFTFDIYFNPAYRTKGGFQTKVFANNGIDASASISSEGSDAGNGFVKTEAVLDLTPSTASISDLTLSIVGSETDYKGPVFIDNIRLLKMPAVDAVPVTKKAGKPAVIKPPELAARVTLVDASATAETARLYAYLQAVGKTKQVIYGHQNDTHHWRGASYNGSAHQGDTKDITGSIAGIVGIDSLSFTGAEYPGNIADADADFVAGSAKLSIEASKQGALITLSTHMPNFDAVSKKPKLNGAWDFSGYTPNDTSGDVMRRILPGGDLNAVFTDYLDIVASYANQLAKANVPVLFRPFHENNGSWFWWGAAFSSEEGYKNVFRYMVEYLRDEKGVHNFLYVYSPNGPFASAEEYESRYPGDEFIDIIAFDYYDNADGADSWMFGSFKDTVALVDGIAEKHGKISAVSECGMSTSGIAKNSRKSWFSDVLEVVSPSNMAYYMVWANFAGGSNYMAPYKTAASEGHGMVDAFIDFYNNKNSVFADGTGFYSLKKTPEVNAATATGYLLSPAGGVFIENGCTLLSSVQHPKGEVSFTVGSAKKSISLQASPDSRNASWYTAAFDKTQLDSFGKTAGYITVKDGDKALSTTTVFFGEKAVRSDPAIADDFESYYGENTLLQNDWSVNSGSDCNNTISLSSVQKRGGDYGMEFKYRISTKGGEGYTGEVKNFSADWSPYNALQLWLKGDGQKQKVVIQIKSGNEEFEVFLNEYPAYNDNAAPHLITLPFAIFKGKEGGAFDASRINAIGLWINTVPQGNSDPFVVESSLYYDDIKAIKTSLTQVTIE